MRYIKDVMYWIIAIIIFYLVGSFVALDFNFTHWSMFLVPAGRLFFLVFVCFGIFMYLLFRKD